MPRNVFEPEISWENMVDTPMVNGILFGYPHSRMWRHPIQPYDSMRYTVLFAISKDDISPRWTWIQ